LTEIRIDVAERQESIATNGEEPEEVRR
jgi:hypothetical protein